ncbi:MAG: two pore domain potassium channel family protein [Bacilli bacterium]|nr:two pore domain potassium channel family protein [Bacilli bacterium]
MAEKAKKKFVLDHDIVRIILIILGSIFSTLVLAFSIFAINEIQGGNMDAASKYLLVIFIIQGLSRLVTFFVERTKLNFIRFASLFLLNVVLGLIILFGKENPYFFSLVGGLYCTSIIISRIFKLVQNHSTRSIILNGIIIVFAILLSIGLFIPYEMEKVANPVIILCTLIAVSAFLEVISTATNRLKLRVLFKIIVRTYALEIILGLVTIMVGFSLLLAIYEPEIPTFSDGLWHSFATVTTIGFGDFKVVTAVGRALTAIMGIYGIVVVAVITSIIVNFYNETTGKKDKDEFKDISEEEAQSKKKKK